MADSFNQIMVTKYQEALTAQPLAKEVTIEGTKVSYDDALKRLAYFERRLAREQGTRPIASQIHLGPPTQGVNV